MKNDLAQKKVELILKIEIMIEDLSKKLNEQDKEFGWTEEKRLKWLNWFIDIKEIVKQDEEFKKGVPASITRAMDFDGICGGGLRA